MARYDATIESAWSMGATFDYLATFSNAAAWDPGVASGEALQPGPPRVGAVYRLGIPLAGRKATLDYQVTAIDRPRRVVLRADHPLVRSTDTITFAPSATGTTVRYDAILEPKGLLRLFAPIVSRHFRAVGDRAVTGLRSALA